MWPAQPTRSDERLSAVTRVRLLLVAIGLVAGLAVVPAARVAACDCAMTELSQAIRDADVAFVGRLAGTDEPVVAPAAGGPPPVTWTWNVERSRDPISADTISMTAWHDDGANCGVAFGVDERWLVMGQLVEGRLQTNGCMSNLRMDGSDPERDAIIDSLVTYSVRPASEPEDGGLPMPVMVLLVGAVALGVISVAAFRGGRAR
jgi:hypothetical protein